MTESEPSQMATPRWKQRLNAFYQRIKSLQGDPHYVAIGMASGVFIAVTPTIPFHTVLALAFAIVLKGSKPAAVLGAWFCNPITIAPIYYGSYKLGMLMLGREIDVEMGTVTLQELMALGTDVAIAMVVGGALLGVIPAVAAYFLTFHLFRKIRARRKRRSEADAVTDPNVSKENGLPTGAENGKKQSP